jgi:hypothetical protein
MRNPPVEPDSFPLRSEGVMELRMMFRGYKLVFREDGIRVKPPAAAASGASAGP